MDKDVSRTRNYVSENTQITTQNNKKETVRNMTNSSLGKRKKKQEKKNKYLQEWVDKALQQDVIENDSDFSENIYPPNFYHMNPMHQQRIHSAISDPSFCRFGVPVNPFLMEPSSLPYYNHSTTKSHQYIPQPNYNVPRNTFPNRKRCFNSRQNHTTQTSVVAKPANTPSELQFTSLPPVDMTASSVDDSQDQRRFSDPGLGSNGDGQDSSDSDDSNGSSNLISVPKKIITTLVEQIHSLKEITTKLNRDMFEMRGELEQVKQHSAWARQNTPATTIAPASPLPVGNQTYTPGMLADAIREVRDSTKVREEAFMLRFKSLMDERAANNSLYGNMNGLDSISESGRDIHELTKARINKLETECRLERLEEDLRTLRLQNEMPYLHNGTTGPRTIQRFRSFDSKLLDSERDREIEMELLDLRREVQEAKASRDEAIEKSKNNERLVTILRKKLHQASMNGDTDSANSDQQQQQQQH
ncbi:uncharacterized protein LOC113374058 isoform X1 [Ctenocephalides felis]|uniref:uncharacterized protein LOC113374058 isoform X1 n=1 Tax=Ctenocephalides felis TaxID=7515 RepID=UPI000E6E1086|nr:uncharacterized protein LOC113374058 isoform X1 [Ctenocephalides felis]